MQNHKFACRSVACRYLYRGEGTPLGIRMESVHFPTFLSASFRCFSLISSSDWFHFSQAFTT